ncbi:DESI1 [Symbiodinium necroappetens]|uniref:DESI1 protein n=1 Tax=Symbiodinium necroappetens TaxID=1628268 RepID=A0A812N8W6_9DINO|nr:DESI1 [Symbiodinium necroappetens]
MPPPSLSVWDGLLHFFCGRSCALNSNGLQKDEPCPCPATCPATFGGSNVRELCSSRARTFVDPKEMAAYLEDLADLTRPDALVAYLASSEHAFTGYCSLKRSCMLVSPRAFRPADTRRGRSEARLKQVPVFLNVYDVGDGEEVLLHHFDCAFGMLGIFTETPTARSCGSDSLLSSTARATVIMISEVSEVKALLMQELREFQVQLVGELREMLNQQRESIISEVAVCLRCKNAEAGHSHSKQPTSVSLLDEDDKNLEPFESSDPQYDCDWATLESTTRRLDLFAEELQDADVGHTITHKYEDNLWSQVSITEESDAGALNEHSPDRVLSALPSLGASGATPQAPAKNLADEDVDASVLSRPEEGCSSIASCTSIEVKPESEPGSLWHSPTLESRSPIATNVYLFLYDISHGWACYLSDAVLGQTIRGLYHTSVVIKWDDREEWAMEYYIGEGRIQVSQAGRTAFGRPIDKRFVGISSKTMAETAHFLERQHPMFTEGTYDLAHNNCNSFSAAMLQYLCDWQLGIPKCFIMREQFGKKCCRRTLQLFPVVASSCRVRCVARDNVAFAN